MTLEKQNYIDLKKAAEDKGT